MQICFEAVKSFTRKCKMGLLKTNSYTIRVHKNKNIYNRRDKCKQIVLKGKRRRAYKEFVVLWR